MMLAEIYEGEMGIKTVNERNNRYEDLDSFLCDNIKKMVHDSATQQREVETSCVLQTGTPVNHSSKPRLPTQPWISQTA